jgi:large subunit ribosomal protein L9
LRVVFLEEVEGTAHTGDVKNVAGGFARNYLLPRKLAAPATPHYIEIATQKATKEARRQKGLDEAAEKLLPQVDGKEITIEVRTGDQDKMFGSVTARDVAEQLAGITRIDLEHRQVDLKQPIREIGDHNVKVKLTRNVIANVVVHVLPIGGAAEAAAKAEAQAAAEAAAPVDEETAPAGVEEAPAEELTEASTEDSGGDQDVEGA